MCDLKPYINRHDQSSLEHWGLDLLSNAILAYNPRKVFALFSGGHDSLTATHIAAQHPRFSGAVHINTGIGVPQTREFVRETCKEHNWPLLEYRAEDFGQRFEDIVLRHGFPGPHAHTIMYTSLKERALRGCIRDHKRERGDKIVLVSGCRSQESTRRMGTVEPIQKDGARIWVAIIHPLGKSKVNEYIQEHGLRRNPVVDLIHKSGECLCGAYAKKGELAELETWFPEVAAEIKDLERRVKAKGFYWGWEQSPPETFLLEKVGQQQLPMCMGCDKRHEEEGDSGS